MASLPAMRTCQVHDRPRIAADCYRNRDGGWECKVSCAAFQVRDRLGDGGWWPAAGLQISTAVNVPDLVADYRKAVTLQRRNFPRQVWGMRSGFRDVGSWFDLGVI